MAAEPSTLTGCELYDTDGSPTEIVEYPGDPQESGPKLDAWLAEQSLRPGVRCLHAYRLGHPYGEWEDGAPYGDPHYRVGG